MGTRLVVCDLDGTFLDPAGQVSARNRGVLHTLERVGWPFAIATARPLRDTLPLVGDLAGPVVLICGNGSMTYDLATGETIDYRPISAASVREVLTALRAAHPGLRLGAEHGLDLVLEHGFELSVPLTRQARRVATLESTVDDQGFGKLIVQLSGDARQYYESVRDSVRAGVEVTVSCAEFCEITCAGVTKASAVAQLAARLGYTAEDTLTFGDMPNDLPMLTWSGTAVAMGNAHPSVLAACTHVTARNDEDGVAVFLNRLLATGREGHG
jgi:Cof subfamily protein (haloacid dehalogenase superfamily)